MAKDNKTLHFKKSKQTLIKQNAFLKAFATMGVITGAAEKAKLHRESHYLWLQNDPTYPARFESAYESAVDSLEQEAITRARDGWTEPVYQGGKLVGRIRKKSDTLLIFMLKGSRPEKHRDRIEHTGHLNQVVKIVKFNDTDKDDSPAG